LRVGPIFGTIKASRISRGDWSRALSEEGESMGSSPLRRIAGVVIGLVCLAAFAATAALAGNGHGGGNGGGDAARLTIAGTKPAWTAAAKPAGAVSQASTQSAKVWLAPRNAAQLDSLARAVTDPASAQYRQYLSHAQYVSQFAPTADQLSAVESWLEGAKLQVTGVGPDNHFVSVSGSPSAIASAFGTTLGLYQVNGSTQQAPTSDISVPSSVAGSVLAVTGLSKLGHMVSTNDLGHPAGFANATPCSNYYGEKKALDQPKFQNNPVPYAVCGYTPSQLRGAYGVSQSGLNGSGQTVAITDAFDSSMLEADSNRYSTNHGDAPLTTGQFTDHSAVEGASSDSPTSIADCGGNGWYTEQALDVEAVHGMAQAANVAYYGAASCYDDDLLAQLAQVAQDDTASIVTNSWGEPTFVVIDDTLYTTIDQSLVDAYESVFKQGATEGIGYYFSSGDNGDEQAAWGYTHPDWPTGDSWVTSVGGTSLAVGNANTRLFETGWGTSKYSLSSDGSSWVQTIPFQYGAGGGYSQIFEQPWYQDGVVTNNPTGGRAVPDIAMDADPTTGFRVGLTQTFPDGVRYGELREGGTSLASPLLAGVQADVQQGAGQRLGFANPLIYSLKSQSSGSSSFYDSTATQPDSGNVRSDFVNGVNADHGYVYSVRTFDQDSSLNVAKGWDDITGVGTVTARYIANASGK
jgi:subtilase family serine protease